MELAVARVSAWKAGLVQMMQQQQQQQQEPLASFEEQLVAAAVVLERVLASLEAGQLE